MENTHRLDHLRKFLAPEFVFGRGARAMAGRCVGNMGMGRPLVVTDPGLEAAGWVDGLLGQLGDEGISFSKFAAITPNPKDHEVAAGAEFYLREGCDGLVAIGGGSVMDCAKGIGIVVANGGAVGDYEGADMVSSPSPPLLCLPSTAGTAADVSQFAIITDTRKRKKMAIVSKAVVPDMALIDPELTETMDQNLTAATGMDAMSHAFEALASNASSPITDLHALEAIRLTNSTLPELLENLDNCELRDRQMLASLHAGLAFSNASLGVVHAMAHAMGGMLDLPHGECNALLLPVAVEFNFPHAAAKYSRAAKAMGITHGGGEDECRVALVEALLGLRRASKSEASLSVRGVSMADLPTLAGNAIADVCVVTNPRPLDERLILGLFQKVF